MPRRRSGSLVLRPRKGVPTYHAVVTVSRPDGSTQREWHSLETGDKATARRKLKKLVAELGAGQHSGAAIARASAPDTLRTYFEGVETRLAEGDRANIRNHVLPELGHHELGAVRFAHVKALRDSVTENELRRETVGKVIGALRRLLSLAREDELVDVNVALDVQLPKARGAERQVKKQRVILDDAELFALLGCEQVDEELRMMALVARVEGGMRTSDVNRWDWSMIDRVQFARCFVMRSKTASPQPLEVPELLRSHLRAWWDRAERPESGPVFPARRGANAGGFKATRGISYADRLRRGLTLAGVKRHACKRHPPMVHARAGEPCCDRLARDPLFTETSTTLPVDFHSFRRAFSTALASAGINSQLAMRLAWHADAKTHMGYVMATPEMERIPSSVLPRVPLQLATKRRFGSKLSSRATQDSNLWPSASEKGSAVAPDAQQPTLPAPARCVAAHEALSPAVADSDLLQTLRAPRPWFVIAAELAAMMISKPEIASSFLESIR